MSNVERAAEAWTPAHRRAVQLIPLVTYASVLSRVKLKDHPPCAECRRADAQRFKAAWIFGNPQFGIAADCSIDQLDRHLHTDRRMLADEHKLTAADLGELPRGVIVADQSADSFYLLKDQRLDRDRLPARRASSALATLASSHAESLYREAVLNQSA